MYHFNDFFLTNINKLTEFYYYSEAIYFWYIIIKNNVVYNFINQFVYRPTPTLLLLKYS